MPDAELRKRFESAVARPGELGLLAMSPRGSYVFRPVRILWRAIRTSKQEWSAERIAACYLMLELLDAIEATGGLVRGADGQTAPAADAEWLDLGDVCERMLGFLQREAGIPANILTIKEESNEE